MYGPLFDPHEKQFEVYRSDLLVTTLRGHLFDDHTRIDFHNRVDVRQYDIIVAQDTGVRYYVSDIIQQGLDRFNGFANMHYFAIIKPQPNVIQQYDLSSLQMLINNALAEDKTILNELLNCVKAMAYSDEPIPRGKLSKFSDVLLKYSSIASSVGQFLLSIIAITR